MNAKGNKRRRSTTSPSRQDSQIQAKSLRIILTEDERDLLLKACLKFRYTIPAYIQSRQAEAETLDVIIGKLS